MFHTERSFRCLRRSWYKGTSLETTVGTSMFVRLASRAIVTGPIIIGTAVPFPRIACARFTFARSVLASSFGAVVLEISGTWEIHHVLGR